MSKIASFDKYRNDGRGFQTAELKMFQGILETGLDYGIRPGVDEV